MSNKFTDLTQNFSPERQQRIQEKVAGLETEMALSELRRALDMSQVELAEKLDIKQPAVSRLEGRADMYVSHLRTVIEAMGGELEIRAKFPSQNIVINNFQGIGKYS